MTAENTEDLTLPSPPWLTGLSRRFAALLDSGRLPHALLLGGTEGIGKEYLADRLVRRVLCHSPEAGEPCGQCKSCLLLDAETHLDFRLVSVAEDAKSIVVSQIRELMKYVTETPQLGRWKVALIHDADKMNISAANALLKGLEEPPANTLLILVSDRPYSLLATIRSRCQIWNLESPSAESGREWLASSGVAESDIDQLMTLANQRPFRAWRWYRQGQFKTRSEANLLLSKVLNGDITPMEAAAKVADMDAVDSMETLMSLVHDRAQQATSNNSPEALKLYTQFFYQLQSLHREISSTVNPQLKLLWENVLLRWQSLQWRLDGLNNNTRG